MEYPDLPSVVARSIMKAITSDRKCFYYYCSEVAYCRNSLRTEHPPYRVPVSPSFDQPLKEVIESRCNCCSNYCLYHLFTAEYMARRYGPVNDE